MRKRIGMATMMALASCVPAPRGPVAPPPARPAPPPAAISSAVPPRIDWRDVPLTPGRWLWRRDAGGASFSQYGMPGAAALLSLRCDAGRRVVAIARAGSLGGGAATMTVTTSFGAFALPARDGVRDVGGIVGELPVNDPRLDQLAFSRGRFLVDLPGRPRLVVPAWPEAARVIEDCRG
ncbi:MAG TPA: hypothetical protein VGC10_06320 [Sphingomonas sp.]